MKQFHPDYSDIVIDQNNLDSYASEKFDLYLDSAITVVIDNNFQDDLNETGIAPDNNINESWEDDPTLQFSYITDDNGSTIPFGEIISGNMDSFNTENLPAVQMQAGSDLLKTNTKDFCALAFPYLFPHKTGHPNASKRKLIHMTLQEEILHIMLRYKSRATNNMALLVLIFDILQWRQILNGVQFCIKNSSTVDSDIIKNLTLQKLNDAISAKLSGEYNDPISSTLARSMNIIGKAAPFSQFSKRKNLHELHATLINKGSPSFYITITPDETKNVLAYVLQLKNPKDFDWSRDYQNITSSKSRQNLSKENPTGSTIFFHTLISTLLNQMFSINGPGLLGNISSYYGMVETQGRGTLHVHILFWLHNDIPKLDLFNNLQENSTLEAKIAAFLDNVIQSDIIPFSECLDSTCAYNNIDMSYVPVPEIDQHFNHTVWHILSHAIKTYQYHIHTYSCQKNDSTTCRYRMPNMVTPNTFFDKETGSFQLHTTDGFINCYNWIILLFTNSNMDMKFLHSGI